MQRYKNTGNCQILRLTFFVPAGSACFSVVIPHLFLVRYLFSPEAHGIVAQRFGRRNGYRNELLEMACLSHKTELLFHDSFLTIYNDYTFISLGYTLPGKVKDVPVCAAEDAVCAAGNVYANSLYRRESYIEEE